MYGRVVLVPAATLVLLAALVTSALIGYRLGRDAEREASRVAAAMPGDRSDTMSGIAADVGRGASVLVSGMRFQPDVIRIKAGQSVTWAFNDGSLVHSVTAFDGEFDSGPQSSGTFAVRFETPGTYCYLCKPHPGPNLCEQGAQWAAGPLLLAGTPLRTVVAGLNLAGGGGMQGKVIVEE